MEYQHLLRKYQDLIKLQSSNLDQLCEIKIKISSLEGHIFRLIEIANIGFSQRYVGLDASSIMGKNILSAMFGGLNRVAHAAAILPDFYYTSVKKKEFIYPWLGYIFFKQVYGYEIISEGEVISMPESAILYPLFPGTTWMTLTHEIAHGFYFRFGLHKNEEFLEHIKSLKDVIRSELSKDSGSNKISDDTIEALDIDGEAWELFAHWLDFKFIYNAEIDFYLWCIWSSWSQVPRVYQNYRDYIIRSVLIYISSNYMDYANALSKSQQRVFFREAFDYIFSFLNRMKLNLPIPKFTEDENKKLYNKTQRLAYLIGFFEEKVDLEKIFVQPKSNSVTGKNITKIMRGEVILNPIENPLMLLRELQRAIKDTPSLSTDIGINIALICSLSNSSRVRLQSKIKNPNHALIRNKIKQLIR